MGGGNTRSRAGFHGRTRRLRIGCVLEDLDTIRYAPHQGIGDSAWTGIGGQTLASMALGHVVGQREQAERHRFDGGRLFAAEIVPSTNRDFFMSV